MSLYTAFKSKLEQLLQYTAWCYKNDRKKFYDIVGIYLLYMAVLLLWVALEIHNGLRAGWKLL